MNCPNCGKSIKDEGIKFCPYCGEPLGQINQDLHDVTKIQIEYQEAKGKSRDWGIGAAFGFIGGIVFLLLMPFTFFASFFLAVPFFILGIVSIGIISYYDGKARRLKNKL